MLSAAQSCSLSSLYIRLVLLRLPVSIKVSICRLVAEIANGDPKEWTLEDIYNAQYPLACVNETLRIYNTAVGAARIAVQDTILGCFKVPAGTVCISDIYAMHRNEVSNLLLSIQYACPTHDSLLHDSLCRGS